MYTYAFLSTIPPRLPSGILGSLQIVSTGGLAALVEPDFTTESLQDNVQQLMQAAVSYDRVIRELFEQTTILPLRFGTCFVSRQGLLDHLQANSRKYLTKLEELQGKAEYALKLTPINFPGSVIGTEVKGKDYFLAKKQTYQAATAWQVEQIRERETLLAAIAQQYSWVQGGSDDRTERIYLLSDRQSEPLVSASFKTWQLHSAHWELMLEKLLPPYHFV